MAQRGRNWCLALLAVGVLLPLAGCFGVSQNPSYFPYLLPTGDIIQTHAKPGFGYYNDFDKHACRLEVRPLDELMSPRIRQPVTARQETQAVGRRRIVQRLLDGWNRERIDERLGLERALARAAIVRISPPRGHA